MKIALIGYGKMGRAVERQAVMRGHEITARIDSPDDKAWKNVANADVAIEFSQPDSAESNVERCQCLGLPTVSGTTGWTDGVSRIKNRPGGAWFLWSSNFSIGVNAFRLVNRFLTGVMSHLPQYTPTLTEVHHIHKLDHPSGTAITLADEMVAADPGLKGWSETPADGFLPVFHQRLGETPGIHTVKWDSPVDSITFTHDAKGREGFALGAVMAAEWLLKNPGVKTIDEMMQSIIGQ